MVIKVAVQELHRLHNTSGTLASDVVVPLMIVAMIIGVLLAIWIFRGGLSRYSSLTRRPSLTEWED
jgi:hypothetical protein